MSDDKSKRHVPIYGAFVKKDPEAITPTKGNEWSIGYDLHIIEETILKRGETKLVGTGIIAVPPDGFYWQLHLRSSTPLKYPGLDLANNIGIIDPDYCGLQDEIKLILRNVGRKKIHIHKGSKIAQLILVKIPTGYDGIENLELHQWRAIYDKNEYSRGGFGSTDRYSVLDESMKK